MNKDPIENNDDNNQMHQELSQSHHDPLIRRLHQSIRIVVKFLSVLMVLVIILGAVDIVYVLYEQLLTPPYFTLLVPEIFEVFGAFMVVLIAIEIFINIRLYLGSSVLPVKLVVATALMAVARKIIVLDLKVTSSNEVFALAATVLALGVTYWVMSVRPSRK
ncbi:Uncharacterized membrane protein, DUF373 family [Alteromonadaceae bacterium Bs31]|nr:Uncharacterized membrane protein, DUF373 family [Alteromonadaceae bacterium Bs31]